MERKVSGPYGFRSFDGEVKRLISKTEEFVRGLP
jgi:hypothetical protein